ncbi:MAG: hypothetical protein K2J40_02625 [Ruminococcus sp.]|nr:hypothetical protein [Ruminococcus sp.]
MFIILESGIFWQMFLVFLVVEILLGFFMTISGNTIITKIFIVIGDILQIFWELFMLTLYLLALWTGVPDIFRAIKFAHEIEIWYIFLSAIVTLIFLVFVFLPYGLSKCLYCWYYKKRKVSERWIIPSKIISIITALIYIFGGLIL